MRNISLDEEVKAISMEYDYGIVPGSVTLYTKDKTTSSIKLDLTLLENIVIVVEVSDRGYKIDSALPATTGAVCPKAAQHVHSFLGHTFETIENLLMTLSPLFCQCFQQVLFNKLLVLQGQQWESQE
ncbi:hypothetical protein BDF14DRAFT_1717201 [Spinellus fusiger]|nr:hypothetical protein BDF14DRAFT_1717201 [Spinellus fusiger]